METNREGFRYRLRRSGGEGRATVTWLQELEKPASAQKVLVATYTYEVLLLPTKPLHPHLCFATLSFGRTSPQGGTNQVIIWH
jgi:hypothetical protein